MKRACFSVLLVQAGVTLALAQADTVPLSSTNSTPDGASPVPTAVRHDRFAQSLDTTIKPDPAEAYNRQGMERQSKGDSDGAISNFTKAIELKPDFAHAYNNLGMVKQSKGDWDGSIVDLTKAIELKPDYATFYANRGVAKQRTFDFDGAIADFNKAVELKPDNINLSNYVLYVVKVESTLSKPVLYLRRGGEKVAKGDLDGAIADYNKAIELKPDFADAYFLRGWAKTRKDDLNAAIVDYTKAIDLKPDFALAYNNRGWCEFLKNDFDSATNDATHAIQLISTDRNYSATNDTTHAIQLISTDRNYYDTRAWARFGKGDVAGALADCKKALGLSRFGSWEAVETQGMIDFLTGDYNRAYEKLNNTFQHDSSKRFLLPMIEKAKVAGKKKP